MFPDLYLMRHGQTQWNVEERMQGRLDSPLTALGIKQAQRQARVIEGIGHAGIARFASPQGRAQQTAEIVFGAADYTSDARLVEIDVGAFTGARVGDLQKIHPEIFHGPRLDWYNRTPDGEHFVALEDRVRGFLEELDGPAMIVTHGITLRMIRVVAMGLSIARIEEMPVRQGAVHLVREGRHRELS